jgi:uncharacterized protein with PhoU and TrkA domain
VGPGYNPAYVRAWVIQACELVGGCTLELDGRLIDRATGELLTEYPTKMQLVALLRGRAVTVGGELIVDELLSWVTHELGGVVTGVADTNLSGVR